MRVCLVSDRSQQGVVTDVHETGDEVEYTVFFGPHRQATYPERSLRGLEESAESDLDPAELLERWRLGRAEQFRTHLTVTKLERPLADNLYSFTSSRTERLPYQFKPVLKVLSGPYARILVADEVGLGKTIEAGIILTELEQRAAVEDVLVLCPSALLSKWKTELDQRFEFDFEILDGPAFRSRVAPGPDEPRRPLRAISSLELLRRDENLEVLMDGQLPLDVLIVDEAHHLRNQGTKTNQLGELLTDRADAVVFLTATPLNLGDHDFFELLRLLVPQEFDTYDTFRSLIEPNEHVNASLRTMRARFPPDFALASEQLRRVETTGQGPRLTASSRYRGVQERLGDGAGGAPLSREECVAIQRDLVELNSLSHVFTRTKKREVQEHFPMRRATSIPVELSTAERAFYDDVTEWATRYYREEMFGGRGFATTMVQRQAASCLPALAARLRSARTSGKLRVDADIADELGSTELDPVGEDTVIDLSEDDRAALGDLDAALESYQGEDSKFGEFADALATLVREGHETVLVFSFFVGTIDYLANRLEGFRVNGRALTVLKLYGPMSTNERHTAIKVFRQSSGPAVLLSSEVGSEGLDFQFCAAMVNYDMPWNPMRVEQRIGRLDRYGQDAELIHILNMRIPDTVEDRIFFRLYERIEIFERSIGDLEAILAEQGRALHQLQRDALRNRLTPAEQETRTLQVADVIVRRQQEHEEFDRESRKFLGSDDVFLERFTDIEESRKYVTPEEIRELVEVFIRERYRRVKLVELPSEPDVFELRSHGEPGFAREIHGRLASDPGRATAARRFIARLGLDYHLRLTFQPAAALRDRELEFVSIHHPLVRAIQRIATENPNRAPAGGLLVRNSQHPGGTCCVFVYELEAAGIKDQLESVPVVVRAGEVDEHLRSEFPELLARATDLAADRPLLSVAEISTAKERAGRWIAVERDRREAELRRANDESVGTQLESLRLSSERRELFLREQIERQTDPGILRMRRSQLENHERDVAERGARLEAKRGVTVGHRLVAAAVLVIEPSGADLSVRSADAG